MRTFLWRVVLSATSSCPALFTVVLLTMSAQTGVSSMAMISEGLKSVFRANLRRFFRARFTNMNFLFKFFERCPFTLHVKPMLTSITTYPRVSFLAFGLWTFFPSHILHSESSSSVSSLLLSDSGVELSMYHNGTFLFLGSCSSFSLSLS